MADIPLVSNERDTPKKKKRREQAIVIGTLLLVILTFILVHRRGTNANPVTSDPNSYTDPGTAGGDTIGSSLPSEIAGIPGQTAALEQNSVNAQNKQIQALKNRLKTVTKNNQRRDREIQRLRERERNHPSRMAHPHAPKNPIHVTHRTPSKHPAQKQHSTPAHVHPPTHAGRKNGDMTLHWGSLYTEHLKPSG